MAEEIVIRAERLGKRYVIGHAAERERYVALRDVMARGVRNLWCKAALMARGGAFPSKNTVEEEFWALKDISFEVKRGEVLGIIGRNGAGKSTLLKILSRITEPTEGRVTINGRVASLLEVGTGFHPELTGRENVYLNGAILGMTRAEIRRKFDEIVAFAEVENFLDMPVKRYSSGMYVRLAFAVAAHLEPEILIVDEVLAVGDFEFQQKCLGKMDQVSRREGRTVLFVSHNMGVINRLCPTTIWLDRALIRQFGRTGEVIAAYLSQSERNLDGIVQLDRLSREWADGNELRLRSIEWLCELPLRHGEEVKARIVFETRAPVRDVAVGIGFSDLTGKRILSYETDLPDSHRPHFPHPGVYAVDLAIDALPLQLETYLVDIGCRSGDSHLLDYIPSALQLEVIAGPRTPGFIFQRLSGVRLESRSAWSFDNLVSSDSETAAVYSRP
jgi:lipopolysaccharide transport system ATP-binding protein